MITLELQSAKPPGIVLADLRAHAGEWRESQIPAEFRRAGIFGVESRMDGATLTLRYERQWHYFGALGQYLRARATVYAAGTGAQIYVAVDYHVPGPHYLPAVSAQVLFTVLAAIEAGPWALLFLIVPAGLLAFIRAYMRYENRMISRSSPDANYLVERIENAIVGAPQAIVG